MRRGHEALLASVKRNGVTFAPEAPTPRSGYDVVPGSWTVTPGVGDVSVALIPVSVATPSFVSVTDSFAPSPTLIAPFPLPGSSCALMVVGTRNPAGVSPSDC